MKILVVGSHGFVGGYLCQLLKSQGHEVFGVDKISMYKPSAYELFLKHYAIRQKTQLEGLQKFFLVDCTQYVEVARIIQEVSPEIVINLAAVSVADVCKKNTSEAISSIYQVNANLLEALKDCLSLKRYVFISSSMVYGDFISEGPNEDAPKFPKDPYGAIKLGAEYLVQSYQKQFGIPYAIVRPSAVYGPLDSNLRVTGIFLRNAHLGKPLRVNDKHEILDFTYVEDVVAGIALAAQHPKAENEIFNMTYGEGRTIYDFAIEIQRHYPNVEILLNASVEYMEGLIRPIRGALGVEKAKTLLGYQPLYALETGVEKYVASWRMIYGEEHASALV